MSRLPITHMTLYKHGVGYYVRRGSVEGESLGLTFRREEMDDLLKSLTVIDYGGGQVRGVDYQTPQSRTERLAGNSVILVEDRSLRDLLLALRGRQVRLFAAGGSEVTGTLVGLDEPTEKPLKQSLVAVLESDSNRVSSLPLSRLEGVELQDSTAAADLRFFLQTSLGQESHRSITIRLSPGDHDLEVSYIAPAPTWRVSYRLVLEEAEAGQGEVLLQGWGIFDNRLEEDLTDIALSLTAGMPVSFVYDLYTPHTPQRPVVKDDGRVAAAPVMMEPSSPKSGSPLRSASRGMTPPAPPPAPAPSAKAMMADTVQSVAQGAELGELFQYNISTPVTVGRGQSAMVPIVSSTLKPKKDLIYNGQKIAKHPVATLRFNNSTGLTLEQGPVTVLDNGEYVGEAVLPFTANQAEVVVAYAVELGVHCFENRRSSNQFHSLDITGAYLILHLYDIHATIYLIENRTAHPKKILIEHPRRTKYEMFDTPEPAEETASMYRFRVEVPANERVNFQVQERWLRATREEVRQLSYQNLQTYFEKNLLSRNTYRDLHEVLDMLAKTSTLREAIKNLKQRTKEISEVQARIRQNIGALQNSGDEGKLRGKYVQQLADSETELADIDQKITQLDRQILQNEGVVTAMIANLDQSNDQDAA